jgi:hypothetical protein
MDNLVNILSAANLSLDDWIKIIMVVANLALVIAIYWQTRYIRKQTYAMFQSIHTQNRLITAQIETVWMPEVVHKFGGAQHEGDIIFVFRRNRPWYPRIKAVVGAREIECEVQVTPKLGVDSGGVVEEKEYHIKMPKELHDLFMETEPREKTYKGKVSLEFYSMARNKYVYNYEIELLKEKDHYQITKTDLSDVNVPWS